MPKKFNVYISNQCNFYNLTYNNYFVDDIVKTDINFTCPYWNEVHQYDNGNMQFIPNYNTRIIFLF